MEVYEKRLQSVVISIGNLLQLLFFAIHCCDSCFSFSVLNC